ncbi:hypothetical protein D9613_003013 [Agrocybe pediades]|uniref:Uncharacterized protein n=1 Tax=Agrocybe pediades TaxID=84607 RepID=A0A8H4QRX4_9AGAR|nr:hypothetical protein D9613_003013 [Agrocybe pediades]KAF9559131.1 hypothetical protein CPC08DRAFT_709023 [Agrocybe pediades]
MSAMENTSQMKSRTSMSSGEMHKSKHSSHSKQHSHKGIEQRDMPHKHHDHTYWENAGVIEARPGIIETSDIEPLHKLVK